MLLYYFYQYEVSITESTIAHTDNTPTTSTNKPPLYAELEYIGTYPIVPPTNSVQYGALVGHRNKVSYIQLVYILYCIIY